MSIIKRRLTGWDESIKSADTYHDDAVEVDQVAYHRYGWVTQQSTVQRIAKKQIWDIPLDLAVNANEVRRRYHIDKRVAPTYNVGR